MSADWLDRPWPKFYSIVPHEGPGLDFWGGVEETRSSAGTYILIARDGDGADAKPQKLQRLFCADETGTLYIGGTKNLAGRLGALGNAIRSDREGNAHGVKRLGEIPWAERFPPAYLAIGWFYTSDETEANQLEAHFAMNLYTKKFGERPPLDGFK